MPILIRIDLSSQKVKSEKISTGHPFEFYAGRALSSKIIASEINPKCDPLSFENKLILSTGFLTGTTAPNSGRISIGAKSPLTQGIKEANVGGRAPALLAHQDIRAIIIEGEAEKWSILKIAESSIEILDGTKYIGKNNYETVSMLMDDFGKKIGIFSIGTAGEKKLKAASIASLDMEGFPSRHAGRGGMGAVLGSKKIKAVVIIPPKENKLTYENEISFKSVASPWFKTLFDTKRAFGKYGTVVGVMNVNEHHGLPTHNFRRGRFDDAEKISGEALHQLILKNNGRYGIPCSPGCSIQCSNLILDAQGHHITSGLEYETVALNGSNLLINNIEALARIDHVFDDVGIDSIESGNALAVFMEAGKLKWGDADAVINLIHGITHNNPDSLLLGQGAREVGKALKIKRVAEIQGQGFPGYDPRTFKGMGCTYVTSPMGADHTAGPAIIGRKAYANKEYGHLHHPGDKVNLSRELQCFVYILDSMGLCYFVGPSWETMDILAKLCNARFGWTLSTDKLVEWGYNGLKMEKDFNLKVGLPSTNQMPEFILNEELEEINRKWDVNPKDILDFWDKI